MKTTVYIDLETGGLDIEKSPIIQIAAIATQGADVVDEFERKLHFRMIDADPEALRLNSFNMEVWASDAVQPRAAMTDLTAFLKKHATIEMVSKRTGNAYGVAQLAGHNAARFDAPMIQSWYRRANEFLPAAFMVLDTLQLALWYCRITGESPANLKLGTLATHFGIESSGAHDALADVRMAHRVGLAIENRMRSMAAQAA